MAIIGARGAQRAVVLVQRNVAPASGARSSVLMILATPQLVTLTGTRAMKSFPRPERSDDRLEW